MCRKVQAPGALVGAPSPSSDTTGSPGTVNVARPPGHPATRPPVRPSARPPGQSGECDRYLYLSGGYGVVVSASSDGSQPGPSDADTSNCLAQVVYRNFSGVSGPTEELPYLVVDGSKGYGDQANNALCGQATRLAVAASAALTEG
jgi:hypothetical protein